MGPWRWLAARPAGWTPGESSPTPAEQAAGPRPAGVECELGLSVKNDGNEGALDRSLVPRPGDGAPIVAAMQRPSRFEHARYLGDKRTQLVYDLDAWTDAAVIDQIVADGVGIQFGPDTIVEARNRGYTLAHPGQRRRHRKPRA